MTELSSRWETLGSTLLHKFLQMAVKCALYDVIESYEVSGHIKVYLTAPNLSSLNAA